MKRSNIEELTSREEKLKKIAIFIFGVFVMAVNYNLFVFPNSFILGGATGISVIVEKAFGINHIVTLYTLNIMLIVVSFVFLGRNDTRRTIIGSLLYPIFITLTVPLCNMIAPYITFSNFLITVLIAGCLNGLANGLVYKVGYNTGGGDILIKLCNKYMSITEGNASLLINSIILLCGVLVFGFDIVIYSIIIIFLSSELIDRIIIGISDCKMFFIYSKKYKKVQEYIMKELNTGVTVISTEGGFKKNKGEMLLVVVPTRDYFKVKESVLSIDEDAFFVVSDCYEVKGGKKRKNLPFI